LVKLSFGLSLSLLLGPSAPLLASATACAGSRCEMTCSGTEVCMTGGCFSDKKDQCKPYLPNITWTTTWDSGAQIQCDQILDAANNVVGVTCKGTAGEIAGDSCTCKFTTVNGVQQCG
jgi:hypothetical protein